MNDNSIETLLSDWEGFKEAETVAARKRREIEEKLHDLLGHNGLGSKTFNRPSDYKITVTNGVTRQVDNDMLQDIAAEHGLTKHLGELFRWKPSIDLAAWQLADHRVKDILGEAITTKPSRPQFKITRTETEGN